MRPRTPAQGIRPESGHVWIEAAAVAQLAAQRDHTEMATSTCPVARSRSCGTLFRFQKEEEVAAEGAPGMDHPVRWMDPLSGMGRAPSLRGNSRVWCRAGTWWFRAFRLVATPSGGSERSLSRSVLGGRTVCLVCDLWSVGRLRLAVTTRRRETHFGELKRLVEVGRSEVGFRRFALSMPGVSWRWKHRRGAGCLLSRRTSRQSSHIGQRVGGPSGSAANGVIVTCVRHRP